MNIFLKPNFFHSGMPPETRPHSSYREESEEPLHCLLIHQNRLKLPHIKFEDVSALLLLTQTTPVVKQHEYLKGQNNHMLGLCAKGRPLRRAPAKNYIT